MKTIISKKSFLLFAALILFVGFFNFSYAGTQGVPDGSFGLQNPLDPKFDSVGGLVNGFMEYFSYLVILLAVLALIFTGLQFVLAQGKPDKMSDLKKRLGWILVGVAIVIGARILVKVVISTLQASGTVDQNVINSANKALNNQ